jgi:hypothetical protein
MSRAAIFTAISQDLALNHLGIGVGTVFANYSLDEKPTSTGPFVILRWQEETGSFTSLGILSLPRFEGAGPPRRLTIWVHYPIEVSADFDDIDIIFDRIDDALLNLEHVDGGDGFTLTCVRATGRGADMKDEGFQTICRDAGYEVLSRRTI